MKRILYIFALLAITTLTSCLGGDPKMEEMDNFMSAQNVPGIYRESVAEFAYDQSKNQCYINTSKLTFAILNDDGSKYLQLVLSKAPVVGESLDVEAKSYGLGLSSSTSYKNLRVDKIENDLCYLRSDATGGYVGIIIGWKE